MSGNYDVLERADVNNPAECDSPEKRTQLRASDLSEATVRRDQLGCAERKKSKCEGRRTSITVVDGSASPARVFRLPLRNGTCGGSIRKRTDHRPSLPATRARELQKPARRRNRNLLCHPGPMQSPP